MPRQVSSDADTTDASEAEQELFEIKSPNKRCRCTCTHCWRLLQCCNTLMIFTLIGISAYEYLRIGALEAELSGEIGEISSLQEEVREKQEVQIQELQDEVVEEKNRSFYSLAGIFTLLTCLISMFHMSSHLQNMSQPIIQRKIVAILWMSPIYSVTSFLSLLYPPTELYFSIVKDFYESYCIYTFLSFLIAVLGHGDRDEAVEVLAKHADHMDAPARCLSRWYDLPPETSDQAKANAVMTECQLMAMQFVFIRPLTTMVYVIYKMNQVSLDEETMVNITANVTSTLAPNLTRWLQDDWRDDVDFYAFNETVAPLATMPPSAAPLSSTIAPSLGIDGWLSSGYNDTNFTNAPMSPTTSHNDDLKKATIGYFKSFSFLLAMIVNVSVFFAFAGLLKFYHVVREDLQWCRPWPKFLTIKGVVFLTFWQGLAIVLFFNFNSDPDVDDGEDPTEVARRYQNILICCEMLFFSITHWCVFPAEEWGKDYKPPQVVNKPGIGIQDFVSDVGYIVRRRRKPRRTPRRRFRRSHDGGFYHRPSAPASIVTTKLADTDDDEFIDEDRQPQITHEVVYLDEGRRSLRDVPSRSRAFSDGSSVKADDEFDDMELL